MKHKKITKRLICILTAAALLLTIPVAALAEDGGAAVAGPSPLPAAGAPSAPGTQAPLKEVAPDAPGTDAGKIEVPYGTQKDAVPFPALTANGGALTLAGAVWECEAFDANTPGEYTFTARLPEGYALAAGAALPSVTVKVAEKQQAAKNITAVNALKEIARQTVPVGTVQSGLNLPSELNGTVDGKENTPFPVAWECAAFDGNAPGEYTFTAASGEGYTLADNLTLPTVTVVVESAAPPFMLFGASGNLLYKIDNEDDWNNVQAWLNDEAQANAVVRINAASTSSTLRTITIPNKNITIESTLTGATGMLRLTSTEAVVLTIKNLNMTYSSSGIDLASGSTLTIAGTNVMTPSTSAQDGSVAAIHVPQDRTLTITGIGASASLAVTATKTGAGIGGEAHDNGEAAGTVNITSGKVTISAIHGAGIGGGGGLSGAGGTGGKVKISGTAEVEITMTGGGAGIGGAGNLLTEGVGGANDETTISGGKVTVYAKDGAGIGGGSGTEIGGAGGTVKISGSDTLVNVTMTRGVGAGIGGGGGVNRAGGAGGNVTITGGIITVTALNNDIGGGDGFLSNGDGGTLAIDSIGSKRTVLDMRGNGTNATLDHSIGVCEIVDATGALTGVYSKLTVTDGTASTAHAQKDYWKEGVFKNGATVQVTAAAPPHGKYFYEWTAAPALAFADSKAMTTTLTMPEDAQAVTANFAQEAVPSITGEQAMTLDYGYAATSTSAYTVDGAPAPTVTLNSSYGGKITWNDTDKKLQIAAGLKAGVYPVTLTADNGVDPAATLAFTLTVEGIAPVITAQPQDASYTAGQAAAPLTVSATAEDGGTLTYQWYQNTANSNAGGIKIDGATAARYTPDTKAAGAAYYYCVVTSAYGGGLPSLSTASQAAGVLVTVPGHKLTSGPDSTQPLDLTKDAVFAFEGEYANLAAIRLNGHRLTQRALSGTQAELSGYPGYPSAVGDVKAGSAVVTLYKEFLQTLPNGTYTLEAEFLDGSERGVGGTQFVILRDASTGNRSNTPATGDSMDRNLWIVLALAAGAAIAGLLVFRYRRKNQSRQ